MKVIALIFLGLIMTGCSSDNSGQLDHFIYVDDMRVWHTSSDCPKLQNGKDYRGHSHYAMHPRDTAEFELSGSERMCANCVTVSQYEHIMAISDRNALVKADRQWLYNKLTQACYYIGSYEQFVRDLSRPQVRRRHYDQAVGMGLDVGSYEEFTEYMGF